MGILRYLLSIIVLVFHAGISFWGIEQGISAVVVFYIISGYVITCLFYKKYAQLSSVKYFYAYRLMRLYPQAVFYIFITVLLMLFFLKNMSMNTHEIIRIIINLSLVPLNFFTYNLEMINYHIVPQMWSLGTELQFYLLIPFILLFRLRTVVIAISFLRFFVF